MQISLSSLLVLESFSMFSEYFICVTIFYFLVAISLATYSVRGLMVQKAVSQCFGLVLIMSLYLIINDDLISLNFSSFHNSISNDYLGFFSKSLLCFFSAVYFFIISDSLKEQKLTSFEYQLVLLLSILGLLIMCSCDDFITAFLAIELSGLAFYILASYRKTSSYSIEGGIKYFVVGAVSSAFFLLGSSFIYGLTGLICFHDLECLFLCWNIDWDLEYLSYFFLATPESIGVTDIRAMFRIAKRDLFVIAPHSYVTEFALSFIFFSLFIKLAAFPFHLWSLDVYEGSPTSSTFFFATITKLSIFVLLIRLCCGVFDNFLHESIHLHSTWVGISSIFVGSFGGLKQRRLKTLLAYSSVTHMGYLIVVFSLKTEQAIQALLLYLIIYMLSGLSIWAMLLSLRLKKKNKAKYSKEIGDLALLRRANSSMAFAFALTMFSIAGIPPLVGFFAKMSVFFATLDELRYLYTKIVFFSLLFSVVSTFYYIRLIKVLYSENLEVGKLYYPISDSNSTIIISNLIFLLIFLFCNPNLLWIFTQKASFLIFTQKSFLAFAPEGALSLAADLMDIYFLN